MYYGPYLTRCTNSKLGQNLASMESFNRRAGNSHLLCSEISSRRKRHYCFMSKSLSDVQKLEQG